MATVLIPIPRTDFDPTETGVPWSVLQSLGHTLAFSTPDGTVAQADPRMLTGERLGILAPLLIADANGRKAYRAMQESKAFQRPMKEGVGLLNAIQDVYLCKEVTVA